MSGDEDAGTAGEGSSGGGGEDIRAARVHDTGSSGTVTLPVVQIVFQRTPGDTATGIAGLRYRARTTVTATDGAVTTSEQAGTTGADGTASLRMNPAATEITLELLGESDDEVWAAYTLSQETHAPSQVDEWGVSRRLFMLGYLYRPSAHDSDLREAIAHYLSDLPADADPRTLNDHHDPAEPAGYRGVRTQALFDSLVARTPR